MTLEEFHSAIQEAVELPIFYSSIEVESEEDMPPKYIFYTTGESIVLEADNIVYWSSTPVELVIVHGSIGIDDEIKSAVKNLLNNLRLPFTTNDEYDADILSWISTYSFNL